MSRHGWRFLSGEDRDAIFASVMRERGPFPGPFHLEIDPIDVCNADCYFCGSADFRNGAILGWDKVHRLLEDARPRGLRSVRLSGGGEPTLYPQFAELIDWLAGAGVGLDNVTTNGIRMKGKIAEALVRVPPALLTVSLNYATRESYERGMRVPAKAFDQIVENLADYDRALRETGRRAECDINLQFFISRDVLGELPLMFELADRLGVTSMSLLGLYDRPDEERLTAAERARFMRDVAPLAHRFTDKFWIMFSLGVEGLQAETAALSAAIHAHHVQPQSPPEAERFQFCLMPWYSMSTLGTGKVYPCCILQGDPAVEPLGDLTTQTLEEVWDGPAFLKYREEIRRSMILGGPVPMWGKLCAHTTGMCWQSGGCHLASQLLEPPEFVRLGRLITEERESPSGRLARMKFGALRRGIDAARSLRTGLTSPAGARN